MRLHPPVSQDEALTWLVSQAAMDLDVEPSPELKAALQPLAEAMAAISTIVLPEEMEPLFP